MQAPIYPYSRLRGGMCDACKKPPKHSGSREAKKGKMEMEKEMEKEKEEKEEKERREGERRGEEKE